MADITMCYGMTCPLRNECYRYTAWANPYRQSYFVIVPYDFEKNECNRFFDNEGRKKYT
jgi:hypothetical protein